MDSTLEIIIIFSIILVFIVIIIYIGVKICSKSKISCFVYFLFVSLILALLLNLHVNPRDFYENYNSEHSNLEKIVDGTWTTVYKYNDDKLLKQISAPGVSHQSFTHVLLPSFNRKCYLESCSIPVMLAHKYTTNIMWKSLKRIHEGPLKDCKYFPKIYYMNDNKRYYIQEYIKNELNKETCPINFKEQLQDLNSILNKNNLFLDDVHSLNWRVSSDGILKIIDCEVYTKTEKNIQQFLLNFIDGSQDGKAKPHADASNILHWNDGRPNIYDKCYSNIK